MPTSRGNHISHLINKVLEIKPKSILDVGIGFGTKGMLFREYTDIWNGDYKEWEWKTKIDGIEIFDWYIGSLQTSIYSCIFRGSCALKVLPTLGHYDLIYAGDILEHFTLEKGIEFIRLLKEHGTHVIISTPIEVSKQGKVFNNPHEAHKSQWREDDFEGSTVNTFGNTMLIHINQEVQCYYCQGMQFYGKKLPFPFYNDMNAKTFFLGLYFIDDYMTFFNHGGERVVFWNGSDVSRLLQNPAWLNYLEKPAKHYCHNKQLADELKTVGIDAEIMPLFFGYKDDYEICFKSSKKIKVFMNAHPGREAEYGVPIVLGLAEENEDILFHIYGIDEPVEFNIIYPNLNNVIFHGQVEEKKMDKDIKKYQACLRLNKHDGMSQIVCKAGLLGLYTIVSPDPDTIIMLLKSLITGKLHREFDSSDITDLKELKEKLEK